MQLSQDDHAATRHAEYCNFTGSTAVVKVKITIFNGIVYTHPGDCIGFNKVILDGISYRNNNELPTGTGRFV